LAARHIVGMNPAKSGGKVGVLLVNLGTPDGTGYWPMRRYLKEFLSDRRVIETNRLLWWFILNFVILIFRPGRKGKDYEKIWNRERNESPLKTITRSQAEKLAAHFGGRNVAVDWAMRYGNPSIPERLNALFAAGCERILIVPLYPQYCAATTASVADKVAEALGKMRAQPVVRFVPPYHDDPVYIEALAKSCEAAFARFSWKPDLLLASFHGIPQDSVDKGDPYQVQCFETGQLMRERMNLNDKNFQVTFQSRFGRAEWLRPYTDETVKSLPGRGVKNLAIVTPGFSADCLETLEEIAGENAEYFHEAGGKNFAAIPCLNDSDEGMRVIAHLVERELRGWL
jgi:ferrochelatase